MSRREPGPALERPGRRLAEPRRGPRRPCQRLDGRGRKLDWLQSI